VFTLDRHFSVYRKHGNRRLRDARWRHSGFRPRPRYDADVVGGRDNRVAALGMNVVLLVNLARSAALAIRFLRGRGAFADLERWQTNYLPAYAAWAAIVVAVFPPLFRYI
jgi:hypothetical protein